MKRLSIIILLVLLTLCSYSQDIRYRRSSLYSVLIRHNDKEFGKDIDSVFRNVPIPDKFDNHNLKIRAINAAVVQKNKNSEAQNIIDFTITPFITKNDIAKRLVSKWFNRKEGKGKDGTFDMNLIIERGLYDADYFAYQVASRSIRGQSLLADAGEDLISQTFVLFNDIRYIDKEEESSLLSMGVSIVGTVASNLTGGLVSSAISYGSDIATEVSGRIAGFRVSITSYLYQLNWTEECAAQFYQDYYMTEPNNAKKDAYNMAKELFSLTYIGCHTIVSENTTLRGVKDKNGMIRKVCERAIDKNIAQLQKEYDIFRVKTPVFTVEPFTAKIGKKEDIDENSKFEVLETLQDENGKTIYKRVGVVRPIKNKIWDNRFMAEFEEENENCTRTETEFEIISGSVFYPGMLLREL